MKKKNNKYPQFIAEIGINHNGSISIAKKLIDLAKEKGFHFVKFQKRELDICIPLDERTKLRETPWGTISYMEYKKKLEFSTSQLRILKNYALKKGIEMFVSCFDIQSLKKIKKLKFRYNKIPSALISNENFLIEVAREKKHTFLSTGMSNLETIAKAVKIFKKKNCEFTLMHCVSLYPCPEDKLNLSLINFYKKKFKCNVGYSGHESTVSPSIYAYILGANVIERHITLDRALWGTDQAASLSGKGMEELVTVINKFNFVKGKPKKIFFKEEKEMLKKFKYW
jgi:N-acetylneuraminate synthase